MEVRNLSQLKKAFKDGHLWVTLEHTRCPDRIGLIRQIKKLQTNGFYSVVFDNPEHEVSKANNGKGSWMDFGKADNWEFSDNGIITNYIVYKDNNKDVKRKMFVMQVLDDIGM